MSDDQDSDYPRFVTCIDCGKHGHFRMYGRSTPEVESKKEGRAMLDASVAQGAITEDQKAVLLPTLEASTIPEDADEAGDDFANVPPELFAGELANLGHTPSIATLYIPGFRMTLSTPAKFRMVPSMPSMRRFLRLFFANQTDST